MNYIRDLERVEKADIPSLAAVGIVWSLSNETGEKLMAVASFHASSALLLVKTAEGKQIVWIKADLMQESHWRGTVGVRSRAGGYYNAFAVPVLDCIRD